MVFTNNAPEGARNWFPCYDHPSDKATFELIAKTPANVLLGSNGSLVDSIIIADTIYYHWKSRDPVATYLVVISAKVNYNLDIVEWMNPETNEIIPTRFYWQDGENINNLNYIKSINNKMMDFFSDLFGTYPFEKNGYATLMNILFTEEWKIRH
jgi:aminopeptidase N